MNDALALRDVTKSFGDQMVVDHVELTCAAGSICGLIGRNGSGKTVLMKMACGLYKPDAGSIWANGQHLGVDAEFPSNTGILIEAPGFLPSYSGKRNLEILISLRGKGDRLQNVIEDAMRVVGLLPELKKRVSKYSLGMRQRLGIAQAIMEDPALLILDEPMNGLDNQGVSDMRKLFLDLKARGKTILLASHNREDIEVLCDQVYEMDAGVLTRIR